MPEPLRFPDGKRFAFTILDDTDVGTLENVQPVYALLHDLGMRTTKTVWPLSCADPRSNFKGSDTLENPDYLRFVQQLQAWGFEITWHSATMESSRREDIVVALERFREMFGHFPRIHVSHAENRENPYWGTDRVDSPIVRWLLGRVQHPKGYFAGHVAGSEFWWGDLCQKHIEYGRNLTFDTVNLASVNPSTPYHDPRRPLIRRWFSSSDAEDVDAFVTLLRPESQDRLEHEGGFCIVATHVGKGFAPGGRLDARVRSALERLAAKGGWFPPVGELLDWLLQQRGTDVLPEAEWSKMQLRFATHGIRRILLRRLRRHRA